MRQYFGVQNRQNPMQRRNPVTHVMAFYAFFLKKRSETQLHVWNFLVLVIDATLMPILLVLENKPATISYDETCGETSWQEPDQSDNFDRAVEVPWNLPNHLYRRKAMHRVLAHNLNSILSEPLLILELLFPFYSG